MWLAGAFIRLTPNMDKIRLYTNVEPHNKIKVSIYLIGSKSWVILFYLLV